MKNIIYNPALFILKHRNKISRSWLIKYILPFLMLVFLSGCQKESIGPVHENHHIKNAKQQIDKSLKKTTVTIENAECVGSCLPGKLLRLTSSPEFSGVYLQPFESLAPANPMLGQTYRVVYQLVMDDGRFDPAEDEIICLATPWDMEEKHPVKIISMQQIGN